MLWRILHKIKTTSNLRFYQLAVIQFANLVYIDGTLQFEVQAEERKLDVYCLNGFRFVVKTSILQEILKWSHALTENSYSTSSRKQQPHNCKEGREELSFAFCYSFVLFFR